MSLKYLFAASKLPKPEKDSNLDHFTPMHKVVIELCATEANDKGIFSLDLDAVAQRYWAKPARIESIFKDLRYWGVIDKAPERGYVLELDVFVRMSKAEVEDI